jgi:MarR family transcriptional regulator, organic hydroperoxide resistance regulator
MSTEDFPRSAGSAAIGARLRRLSERIDREADAIYAQHGEGFQQRWFGVVNQLDRRGALTVTQLAQLLKVSHPAVSQVVNALNAANMLVLQTDSDDGRRRLLALSPLGQAAATRMRPLWDALDQLGRALDAEAGGVVAALDRLEDALDRAGLAERLAGLPDQRTTAIS